MATVRNHHPLANKKIEQVSPKTAILIRANSESVLKPNGDCDP